jgi:hypothetical protein
MFFINDICMKFSIEGSQVNINVLFRRAGYHFDKRDGNEMAFARSLTGQKFPRFHAFCKMDGVKILVNIHIDHKAASYVGTSMHSGEYDSDSKLLQDEAERLKNVASD